MLIHYQHIYSPKVWVQFNRISSNFSSVKSTIIFSFEKPDLVKVAEGINMMLGNRRTSIKRFNGGAIAFNKVPRKLSAKSFFIERMQLKLDEGLWFPLLKERNVIDDVICFPFHILFSVCLQNQLTTPYGNSKNIFPEFCHFIVQIWETIFLAKNCAHGKIENDDVIDTVLCIVTVHWNVPRAEWNISLIN